MPAIALNMSIRGQLLSGVRFNPSALFAANEVGVWYDPSDVANLDWRRNLLTYTEQFDNAAWSKVGLSVSANAAASPTGSVTADKVVEDTSTGVHITFAANALTQTSTISLYVKAAERSIIGIGNSSDAQFAQFDLSSGTVISAGSGTISGGAIASVGDGWYRISCLFTFGGVNKSLGFTLYQSSGVRSYTGDGTSGILIWGAQLEVGSTATEYQRITDVNTEVRERFPTATLFQDAAGTTPVTAAGQPVGLILDKSRGLALGPELVTNGDFSAGSTGWTTETGWSISGGVATKVVSAANANLFQDVSIVAGRSYRVTYTLTYSAGGFQMILGGTASSVKLASGTYSEVIVAGSTNLRVSVFGNAAFAGSIDNISVRELPGNHATQATAASRPTYGVVPATGRRNLLTYTEQFDNAAWVKGGATVSANQVAAPDGTLTADKLVETSINQAHYVYQSKTLTATSYTTTVYAKAGERTWLNINCTPSANVGCYFDLANGVLGTIAAGYTASITSVGNGWYRCSVAFTATAASWFIELETALANGTRSYLGDGTSGIYIWGAQLEVGSTATNYQRVESAFDVTEAGVQSLSYLFFDGVDDFLVTPTITPGTDKVQVFAGVRKLSDAATGIVVETSAAADLTNGALALAAPSSSGANSYRFVSRGTNVANAGTGVFAAAPNTSVATGLADISGDTNVLRRNGLVVESVAADQGTGDYLAYPIYIGRRGGTTLPFNGQIYSLIVRFGANLDANTISHTETWVNSKTGAY